MSTAGTSPPGSHHPDDGEDVKAKGLSPAERAVVVGRERGLCARCGLPGTDWHHRRSRSVRGPHTHCACNGVLLCRADHQWAHANPDEARQQGFIVRRTIEEPFIIPTLRPSGWFATDCGGALHPLRTTDIQCDSLGEPTLEQRAIQIITTEGTP